MQLMKRLGRPAEARARVLFGAAGTSTAQHALTVGALVVGVWVYPPGGTVALVLLALFSLKSSKAAIQAVTLAWMLTSLNPEIYASPPVALRWLVLLAATLGVLHRIGFRGFEVLLQRYVGLLVFAGVAVASAFVSAYPGLTLSRLVGFSMGVILIVGLFSDERDIGEGWTTRWFMGLFWAVVFLSAPLLAMELGFTRNASGFQGILNHPQAMGVFLAPYVAALALIVVKRGAAASITVALASAGTMLYATEARTGMLAAGIGVVIAVAVGLVSRNGEGRLKGLERRRSVGLLGLVALAVGMAQLLGSGLVSDTVFKSGRTGGDRAIVAEFQGSRGSRAGESLHRFVESPLIGKGFGVPADVDRRTVSTILGGVPVSASIESGIAVTGLLEQVGILGLVSIGLLLYQVLRPVFHGRSLIALALAVAAVSTNLGEATIFSFGGMGLFVWLVVGWARILDHGPESPAVH